MQRAIKVLEKKVYPQQAYKSCDGILSFDKKIGRERLIKACKRADEIGHYGYKVIENILKRGTCKVSAQLKHSGYHFSRGDELLNEAENLEKYFISPVFRVWLEFWKSELI